MSDKANAAFIGGVFLSALASYLYPHFEQIIIFIMFMGIVWADLRITELKEGGKNG